MREASERIERTAQQLTITDRLLDSVDQEYHLMRQKLTTVPSYADFLGVLYQGQDGRQMVLGDLFEYMICGRGYWLATRTSDKFKDYIKIILYLINLVLIQESVFSFRSRERQVVLQELKEAGIEGFFNSDREEREYEKLKEYSGRIVVRGPTRPLYKVMDSLTPKPLGVAIELIVYVHLLIRSIGYVVPLLLSQRLFNGNRAVAPPDYLVLLGANQVLGVEVGGGMGQYSLQQGKIDQINLFIQETGIPVITAGVPHIYRCETCECWITFCDEIIDQTANGESKHETLSCLNCPRFDDGKCPHIVYYGQVEPRGPARRHHYDHYRDHKYVQEVGLRTLRSRQTKLIQYFPVVKGLESLAKAEIAFAEEANRESSGE